MSTRPDSAEPDDEVPSPEVLEYRNAYIESRLYVPKLLADPELEIAEDLMVQAKARGWHDIVFALYQAHALQARHRGEDFSAAVNGLKDAAEASGDLSLIAKGIACELEFTPTEDAEQELARAVALLDVGSGSSLHRPSAYVMCGLAYRKVHLWALHEEMNREALKELLAHPHPWLAAVERASVNACRWNLMDALAAQASEAFEVGANEEIAAIAARAPEVDVLPEEEGQPWVVGIAALSDLLAALNGEPKSPTAPSVKAARKLLGATRPTGSVLLAHAVRRLRAERFSEAADLAETALGCITMTPIGTDVDPAGPLYALALRISAMAPPYSPRALRYGQEVALRRREIRQRDVKAALVRRRIEQVMLINRDLTTMAYTDALTGLTNRRGYDDYRWRMSNENPRQEIGVLLIDVNRFKEVNDTYGHTVGDKVLIAVAEALRASVRGTDLAARTGGDEFVILLPSAPYEATKARAESLSRRIEAMDWSQIAPGLQVTASVGHAAGQADALDQLLIDADRDMYQVKEVAHAQLASGQVVTPGGA